MTQGTIIFLNGPSSAGKTTLTRTLQHKLDRPFYHLAYDTFNQMLPKTRRDFDYWANVRTLVSALHHTIGLFSDLGLGVIVDHVLLDTLEQRPSLAQCVQLLHTYRVLFVGVFCPIDELERRERARGDRRVGQARSQASHQYPQAIYDVTVDTFAQTPEACADSVLTALAQPSQWQAFHTLYRQTQSQPSSAAS
jgi:chloramphenicol 3-O-phosphotransferase